MQTSVDFSVGIPAALVPSPCAVGAGPALHHATFRIASCLYVRRADATVLRLLCPAGPNRDVFRIRQITAPRHKRARAFKVTRGGHVVRIKQLNIQNFRCLRDATLQCTAMTALVGRNGAGKSTFLAALDKFFDPNSRLIREDVFAREPDATVTIQVAFADLRNDERDAFSAYVQGDTLTITKRFALATGVPSSLGNYFATRMRFTPFADVRGTADEMKEAINKLMQAGVIPSAKLSTKKAISEFMENFEAENPDKLEPVEDTAQFFGEKNVGGGKLDAFTRFVYVPAVRDVVQETGERKASLSMLLDAAVMQKVAARPEVAELPAKVATLIRDVYNPDTLGQDLAELSSELNKTLQTYVAEAAVQLTWGEPRIPNFEPPPVIPKVVEDCFPGDPAHKGHGLQRALIFTLLTHRQMIQPKPVDSSPASAFATPDLILAIEEPELYQHPTRCRHIAEVLAALTSSTAIAKTQVLYTTHSPYFVALDRFQDVRIARKPAVAAGTVPHTKVFAADWQALRSRWAEICDIDVAQVTTQTFVARALPAMSVVANEGYFADAAVIVEGNGDAALVAAVARQTGAVWSGSGIAILPVGGKSNVGAPILILEQFGVPVYFLFDADKRFEDKPKESASHARQNRALLRIGGAKPVDFPADTVASGFACFADEAETYCRAELGSEVFEATVDSVSQELDWFDSRDVLKTPKGATRFVELVYGAGHSLPLLESIVKSITNLVAKSQPIA
jgi:putative ATP-dependent endonuclease of OLD family